MRSIENLISTKVACANRRLGGQPAEGGIDSTKYHLPIAQKVIDYFMNINISSVRNVLINYSFTICNKNYYGCYNFLAKDITRIN